MPVFSNRLFLKVALPEPAMSPPRKVQFCIDPYGAAASSAYTRSNRQLVMNIDPTEPDSPHEPPKNWLCESLRAMFVLACPVKCEALSIGPGKEYDLTNERVTCGYGV